MLTLNMTLSKLRTIPARLMEMAAPIFAGASVRAQSQMDISEASRWRRESFVQETGGFFIPNDPVPRRIAPGLATDLVRRDMLVLLMRSLVMRGVEGDIAELGVYRGLTARILHAYLPDRTLLLFDTFRGFERATSALPRATMDGDVTGLFADTSVGDVMRYVTGNGTDPNVLVRVGLFPDSALPEDAERRFALVHLDADQYAPTFAGLEFFWPRMNRGGYLLVHDYNSWLGARSAVDEFCAPRGIVPFPMPDKSGTVVLAAH